MKVELTSKLPERKLLAVIGDSAEGIYFRDGIGCRYLSTSGVVGAEFSLTLEALLADSKRKAIYAGDTVTITF